MKQTIEALCVAMGGVILLLVLGTEILDARWLAAVFAISFLVGFRNLRARLLSRYGIAQAIDRNAVLHDALSTAFFYNRVNQSRKAPEELRAAQFSQAERLASEVRVERAFPYVLPRSLYFMSVLGLIASSLIAVRYGISRRLDLRPPLARVIFDVFHFADPPQQAAKKNPAPKRMDDLLKQFGLSLDQEGSKKAPGSEQSDPAQTLDKAETRQPSEADRLKQQGISIDPQNQKQGEENPESASNGASEQGDQERSGAPESESGANDSGRQQAANSQNENNSLLQKFRDAMANLLSRLKAQPQKGQSQQMASKGDGRPDSTKGRQQASGQKTGQQAAGRQSDPSQGQPQGDQEGEGNQKAQAGSGKQSGDEAERASQEGRSGIGKEDGSKAVRDAEQLAAMGKISEILGKRSQNLTGEVMVEVNSGKEQQLRTAWSQQRASHADAGGEIHRDEIPLAYQRYVQQYFDEIRKAAPPKPPAQP